MEKSGNFDVGDKCNPGLLVSHDIIFQDESEGKTAG